MGELAYVLLALSIGGAVLAQFVKPTKEKWIALAVCTICGLAALSILYL